MQWGQVSKGCPSFVCAKPAHSGGQLALTVQLGLEKVSLCPITSIPNAASAATAILENPAQLVSWSHASHTKLDGFDPVRNGDVHIGWSKSGG